MNHQFQPVMPPNRRYASPWIEKVFQLACLFALFFLTNAAQAQNGKTVTVKGFVTNPKGEPLSGVSIQVNGSGAATVSQADGSFELQAPENSTVTISYVGYNNQAIKVGTKNQASLKIQLQNKKDLDEVVVVGYGTRRRSEVTGSVVSVSEQSIKDIPTNNLAHALQGRAAGVDIQKVNGNSKPGAPVSILIRGSRSVRAGNDPLIVVDGIPYSGSFNDLNPDDVSSVEILKDASATAIYGSRGANGVLLISTKRGKNGKPVVTYGGYAGIVKPRGEWPMMNAQEFYEFKKWAMANGRFDDNGVKIYTGPDDPNLLIKEFSTEELDFIKTGQTTNWQDLVYKTGFQTSHQLGVTGGTEATQYALSGGYYKETGIYPGQEFERYTVKISVDQQLNKMFKVGLNSLNSYATTLGEGFNPMAQAMRASPMVSPWDPSGKLRNAFVPGSAAQVWNPLADFLPGALVERRKRLGTFTTLFLEANFSQWLKGLKYRFNGGAELRSDVYGNFYASKTSKNMGAPSTSSNNNSQRTNFTLEHILTYDKTIAEKHKINLTGLFSVQQQTTQNNGFDNNTIFDDRLEYYNPVYASNLTGDGSYEKWALLSYMGRMNYSFDDRYLLTFTVRTDGSSRLAPGNKYRTFPSGAIAWNIHNEKFFHVNAISNLRLRASYGVVGNASISPYQTMARLSPFAMNFGETTTTGVYLTTVNNPTLTWESTATAEVGIDFGLLNNRISGTIGAYKTFTNDLLLPQTLPPTSGIQNVALTNIGKTENQGLELQVSALIFAPKSRDDFSWSVDMNVFLNRGKITKLTDGVTKDVGNNWFVGQPIGVYYNNVKLGIWQNTKADTAEAARLKQTLTGVNSVIGTVRYADVNGDGKLDGEDRIILGSTQPDWEGGFTNRFGYKGFDLTVVGVARMGSLLNSSLQGGGFANTYQATYNNVKTRYWTPLNGETVYPKPNAGRTGTQNAGLLGFFNGSYLKIRTITLGYTLPPTILRKLGARNIKFYSTVEDPFIFFSPYVNHPYGGLDPEAGGSASSPSTGANVNVDTPPTWSVIFGVQISL